ncbi:MAG: hypothetical protein LBQ00_02505 [Syntrophobacterales bacterium]|jgi:alpha-tubulin suppressor-like RCC1 family protein|nr:hypothetical protein [Syntrophobacterales bacterium]
MVWAWGSNWFGQLGDSKTDGNNTPVQVKGVNGVDFLSHVKAIAAGGIHSLALKDNGDVYAWGWNSSGALGNGTLVNYKSTPAKVVNLSGVTAIAAGQGHSLALTSNGTEWAWGSNVSEELGDNTTTSNLTPQKVTGSSNVTAIAAGQGHSLALTSNGYAWACGDNKYGQLGDNTTINRPTSVPIVAPF